MLRKESCGFGDEHCSVLCGVLGRIVISEGFEYGMSKKENLGKALEKSWGVDFQN